MYPLTEPALAQLHVDEPWAGERGPLCDHGEGRQRVHNGVRHVCGLFGCTLLKNTMQSSETHLSLR